MNKKGNADKNTSMVTLKEICEEECRATMLNELGFALDRYKYAFFNGDVSEENHASVIARVKRKINEAVHLLDEEFISALEQRFRRSSEIYRKSMQH